MASHKIAVVPGDGIGIEVIESAVKVLEAVADIHSLKLEFTQLDWGSQRYRTMGRYLPDDWKDIVKSHEAILFGSAGAPDIPDHISLWELLLPFRKELQQYVNIRPVQNFLGIKPNIVGVDSGDIDWLLLRENSEGEYAGQGGRTHQGTSYEMATEVGIFTRVGIERFMRFCFETAQNRPRKQLTLVTKSNAMRYGMVLWDEVAVLVSKDFPDVKWDKVLVDAATVRMVTKPTSMDVIVGTNLHMDILSDLAAALAGSIGIAASSNVDPTRQNPSMFEPVHGSGFDITGKGIANPVAAIWSAAELLDWVGENTAAESIKDAIRQSCKTGATTKDLGGELNTAQVTDAIIKFLK